MFFKFLLQNLVYLYIAIAYVIFFAFMISNNYFITNVRSISDVNIKIVNSSVFLVHALTAISFAVGLINYAVFAFHNYKK
jgi:hypothetical protein